MSKAPIDFWFDFSSPYAYIAANQIDDLADDHGRTVRWRPFLLGPVMKQTGNVPLLDQPLKGNYLREDLPRFARLYGLDYKLPSKFPIAALAPARGFYWLEDTQGPDKAKDFALACLDAFYAEDRDISDAAVCAEIAASIGVDSAAFLESIQTDAVKEMVKSAVAAAIEAGVCGAPFFIVDGQKFWGADRLWMVEEWLESGGW